MQLFLLSALCAVCLALTSAVPTDFYNSREEYEFMYHDYKDLLLVVHSEDCYFVHMPDNNENWMHSASTRAKAEDLIVKFIEGKVPPVIKTSSNDDDDDDDDDSTSVEKRDGSSVLYKVKDASLAAMRDMFADRLADYHCFSRKIHEMNLINHFWNPRTSESDEVE